jgi:hypothetical protein
MERALAEFPHETRPTPELQKAYDIEYMKTLTAIGVLSNNPNISIEKVEHYIDLAKKTSDEKNLLNTIKAATGYEDMLEAKRQGQATYSQISRSDQNRYSFDDYFMLLPDIQNDNSGAYYGFGGIITGIQSMGVSPTEAKPFLQRLKEIDDKAQNILRVRGESTEWTGLMPLISNSLGSVSSLEEALNLAEAMLQGYSNSAIDSPRLSEEVGDFIVKDDPSLPQIFEFIDKLLKSDLILKGQKLDDEKYKKIEDLKKVIKIGTKDPVIQKNIDNFFHQHGFAGNIAHTLLSMPEVKKQLITGADFENDQTAVAMMARVINEAMKGNPSDEFIRKAVEFADNIHQFQIDSLHDDSDTLRTEYYIGNLSPYTLFRFSSVKGRASDFEAITYTSSFIKSYDKLKQSMTSEEYYQMLKDHPNDAALLAVMLGRYGKLGAEVQRNPELFKELISHALENYSGYEGFISEELQSLLVEGIIAGVENPSSSTEYTSIVIDIYRQYPRYRPLATFIMSSHRKAFLQQELPTYISDYITNLPQVERPSPPKWEGNEIKFGLYYVKEKPGDIPTSVDFFKKQGFTETVEGDIHHLAKVLPNGKRIVIDIRFDKPDPSHNYQLIAGLIHSFETNDFFVPQSHGSFKDVVIFGGSCRSASEITKAWNNGYDGSQFIANESIGNPYVNLLVINGIIKNIQNNNGTISSWEDLQNSIDEMIKVRGVKLPNSYRIMFLNYVKTNHAKFPDLKLPIHEMSKLSVSPS